MVKQIIKINIVCKFCTEHSHEMYWTLSRIKFKLTMNCSPGPASWLSVECRVWPESVRRNKYLKVWSTLTKLTTASECTVKIQGESWNSAGTALPVSPGPGRVHYNVTELSARGRSRQTDRDQGEYTHRKWSVTPSALSSPGGNCHKLNSGQFCGDKSIWTI